MYEGEEAVRYHLHNKWLQLQYAMLWSRATQMADRGPNPDHWMVTAGPRQVYSIFRSFYPKMLRFWPCFQSITPRQLYLSDCRSGC